MTPFRTLRAVAAPLLRDNVDTDAIIPSREMRSVSKKGLADGLFAGWRYASPGSRDPDPGFVLNQPRYREARILLGGANFGCGSSREHAVWALAEFGFRAIVAPSFNPIFQGNCVANGVVPATLPADMIAALRDALDRSGQPLLTVDLETQELRAETGETWRFAIDPEARAMLLTGRDPIAQTLDLAPEIRAFRAKDGEARPWIYSTVAR